MGLGGLTGGGTCFSIAGMIASDRMDLLASGETNQVVIWSLVLILTMVVFFAVVSRLRGRLTGRSGQDREVGFTLAELRELHRRGQITDEQFERAKGKIIENLRKKEEESQALPPK